MKLCNDTITVFNARFDSQNDRDVYHATVISGVSWYDEIASTVDSSGLKAADKYIIRIPVNANFNGKAYVDPVTYASASSDPASVFTLKSGDIIVKGAVTLNSGDDPRPSELLKAYAEATTVLGVTDNRRAPRAPHWKIVGK